MKLHQLTCPLENHNCTNNTDNISDTAILSRGSSDILRKSLNAISAVYIVIILGVIFYQLIITILQMFNFAVTFTKCFHIAVSQFLL